MATVIGGLASMMSGKAQQNALEQQAIDEETRAVQEKITGKADALQALRALNRDTAQIAVAGYASGIGGEGSVEAAQAEAEKVGEFNINMARENANFRSSMRRGSARELRREGRGKFVEGIFGGIRGGMSLLQRRYERGPVS